MFMKCKDLSPILALLLIFTLLLIPTGSFADPGGDECSRNWTTLTSTEDAGGGDPDNPVPLDGDDNDRYHSGTVSAYIGDDSARGDLDLLKVISDLLGALSLL